MAAPADDSASDALSHLSGRDQRPIAELLVYVGLELRSLCSAANAVEATVEDLISDNPSHKPETVTGLQELDRLIQHMDGLADYLAALAEVTKHSGCVDPTAARQVLKLARQRQLLSGEAAAHQPPAAPAVPADGEDDEGFELL
jgi:hypothetical protein